MNLNGRITNPGELRTLIGIGERTVTVGANGFSVISFTQTAQVYAKWVNAHGSETQASDAGSANAQATVTIRYRSGIDESSAIFYQGDWWEVVAVDNIRERNEYLELSIARTRAG